MDNLVVVYFFGPPERHTALIWKPETDPTKQINKKKLPNSNLIKSGDLNVVCVKRQIVTEKTSKQSGIPDPVREIWHAHTHKHTLTHIYTTHVDNNKNNADHNFMTNAK